MATKLENLEVTNVDFVDAGANPKAKIMLYKRKGEKKVEKNSKLTEADKEALIQLAKAYGVSITVTPDGYVNASGGVEPEPKPETKDEPKPETKDEPEEVDSLTKALAQVIKNLEGHVEKAQTKEFEEIAKKYEILGLKSDELAPMLKHAKETNPSFYETSVTMLDAAVKALDDSQIFTEVGKRGNGAAIDKAAEIEKFTAEIRKSNPNLSYFKAKDLAYQQHPELI